MKTQSKLVVALILAAVTASGVAIATTAKVKAPLVCTRGDSDQTMSAIITMPASAAVGSKFTVRVDGVNSGKISHTGLNYIFDMSTDYIVPDGTKVVDGSVKVVGDTGTANVRAGAKAWNDKAGIHTILPAHVDDGSDFTPPSLEFQLEVTGTVGQSMAFKLAQYRVAANAFVVGDVHTVCDPNPKPYTLGTTVAAKAE